MALAGFGSAVYTKPEGWWAALIIGQIVGALLGSTTYEFLVGWQHPEEEEEEGGGDSGDGAGNEVLPS
jgi:hypothetical protein